MTSKRVATLVAAALVTGVAAIVALQVPPRLPLGPAEIERLRMRADEARDVDAMYTLAREAARGNVSAQRAFGRVALRRDQPEDRRRGMASLAQAARSGDSESALLLGTFHFEQRTPESHAAALEWLVRAAPQPAACRLLGLMYANGYGVAPDRVAAVKWWQRGAEGGDADAMFLLGNAYAEGHGIERDEKLAAGWWQRAATREHAAAAQALAMAYRDGAMGLPRDPERHDSLMRDAAHALQHQGS